MWHVVQSMSLGWREKLCLFGNAFNSGFVAGLAGWEEGWEKAWQDQKHQQWQFPQQHLADTSAINK